MTERSTLLARKTADALTVAREYSTSEAVKSVINLMDALADQYRGDLETVTEGQLVRVQTAIQQLTALRRAITGDGMQDAKII